MTESGKPPTPDDLPELLVEESHEAAVASLNRLVAASTDARKRTLRTLRNVAEEQPGRFDGLATTLATFLTDDDRAVRLTTAKLFVTLARSEPAVVVPAVDALAERLADDGAFYYVRARCAEALGYVALERPGAVGDPEILADLRIGLSFDEPEVKEKLAKALAYVALGEPSRLRHLVGSLADHLDDESELVRYHTGTALVVVGCEYPEKLSGAEEMLRERLADGSPYVQGRAAEALGLVSEIGVTVDPIPELDSIDADDEETPSFLTDRVRFLRAVLDDDRTGAAPDEIGTVDSVREGTDDVVEEMTSPESDGECPQCGLAIPADGPPICPRCGTPC